MALAVPLSRFTPRVGGGSAFYVRHRRHEDSTYTFDSRLGHGFGCSIFRAGYFYRSRRAVAAALVFQVTVTEFQFQHPGGFPSHRHYPCAAGDYLFHFRSRQQSLIYEH